MNTSELKPCPFCGGTPVKRHSSGDERDGYADRVSYACPSCGCSQGAIGDTRKGGYADNSKVEAEALARWNTRVTSQSQFLTDVMTAAGMISHGKQDKKFASRLADEAACLQMTVTRAARHGRPECAPCCWPPREVPAEPPQLEIGIYGRAFDAPGTKRAYTYKHQPANDGASKLGQACYKAMQKPGGDSIDLGLGLLKQLEDAGFGVFEVNL